MSDNPFTLSCRAREVAPWPQRRITRMAPYPLTRALTPTAPPACMAAPTPIRVAKETGAGTSPGHTRSPSPTLALVRLPYIRLLHLQGFLLANVAWAMETKCSRPSAPRATLV